MKNKKEKKVVKVMYEPTLNYDIRWIQMFLKEKYKNLENEEISRQNTKNT